MGFSTHFVKELLQRDPEGFVQTYGSYLVSEIIYGARTICAFYFTPHTDGDSAYLRSLFADITSDLFFNSAMSEDFVLKATQAYSERSLLAKWNCHTAGPSPKQIILLPSQPTMAGSAFKAWTASLPNSTYAGWSALRF